MLSAFLQPAQWLQLIYIKVETVNSKPFSSAHSPEEHTELNTTAFVTWPKSFIFLSDLGSDGERA